MSRAPGPRWLLPIVLAALLARAASAGAESPAPIYLPFGAQWRGLADPEPCAPLDMRAAACPGQAGWQLICGGMGELRDLVDLGEDGSLMAVGDGVARITPDGRWAAQMGQVLVGLQAADFAAVDGRLTGVAVGDQSQILGYWQGCWSESAPAYFDESTTWDTVHLSFLPFSRRLYGWAAGRQADPLRGLAWAAVASMEPIPGLPPPASLAAWADWRDPARAAALRALPPLGDAATIWRYQNAQYLPETWLLAADEAAARGSFVRADRLDRPELQTPAGQLPTHLIRNPSTDGEPMAYALGRSTDAQAGDATAGTVGWRYDRDGHGWLPAPALTRVGRSPGDAVFGLLSSRAPGGGGALTDLWLGFRPAPMAADLVERLDWPSAAISRSYGTPPLRAPVAESAPVVLATQLVDRGQPLKVLEGLFYGAGDETWRYDTATARWQTSRRRLDLLGFAPDGSGGGIALAAAPDGARLLRYDGRELREDLSAGAALAGLPAPSLIDEAPGWLWLAGAAGTSLRLAGGDPLRARVHRLPPQDDPPSDVADPRDFVDLVALPRGEAWGLTVDARGPEPSSQVWRFDRYSEAWQPLLEPPLAGRLRALDALRDAEGGHAWAVGDGLALWLDQGCADSRADRAAAPDLGTASRGLPRGESLALEPSCGCARPAGGSPHRVCILEAPTLTLADVAQLAPGDAWAVGAWAGRGERLIRLTAGEPAQVRAVPSPPDLSPERPGGLAAGSRFTALAAGAERDVWVLARCGRGAWRRLELPEDARYRSIACGEDPPFYSSVLRFDGAGWTETPHPGSAGAPSLATELNVPIHAIELRDLGELRQIWLAGDWSTLAQRVYAPGDR
ncbi:MAG: hypothetical protein H6648_08910 [Caldilineae bacterium]|nr:hypothetical protein [Chloroflexota bacterium]MCB9177266.1 hypothetical protein [Caldilineae bacterium]